MDTIFSLFVCRRKVFAEVARVETPRSPRATPLRSSEHRWVRRQVGQQAGGAGQGAGEIQEGFLLGI